MQAIRIHAPGGPEALRVEDVPVPAPKAGDALVRVEATGVNFIEVYFRTGVYKPAGYPFTPGGEAAGVVEAVGEGVTGLKPGDRVATVNAQGAYAERCLVAAARLAPVPDGVSSRQAAAAMLQGMTAHYLTASTRPLAAGDACLVHAAAGGVGLLLCRMAKKRGARVIGTVSTEEKAALAAPTTSSCTRRKISSPRRGASRGGKASPSSTTPSGRRRSRRGSTSSPRAGRWRSSDSRAARLRPSIRRS